MCATIQMKAIVQYFHVVWLLFSLFRTTKTKF